MRVSVCDITGCGLGSLIMGLTMEKHEYSSCSVQETSGLSSPNLVLAAQGIPRELLLFSLHGILNRVDTSKGITQH